MRIIQIRLFRIIYISGFCLFMAACNPHKKTTSTSGKQTTGKENSKEKTLKLKYATRLGVDDDRIENITLYSFIDEWYGAPYKYAGKTKEGIDCSGFTTVLYQNVYNRSVSAPSYGLYDRCNPLDKDKLKEGDLVFFKINNGKISHVGVYLQNNKFVHASTKAGVIINDLDEPYYQKYFYKGGRLK